MTAVANGAGGRRAALAVRAAPNSVDAVCNIGFCGALDASMAIGEIFVASSVRSHGREFPARTPAAGTRYTTGPLVSIDRVAQTAEEKRVLRQSGAMAVEMEAGGAAAEAAARDLPFYCVRVVSDLADETFACDYNAALREDGAFDTAGLVLSALRDPFQRFPELLRLQRRCEIAARNLGDFLARCEF